MQQLIRKVPHVTLLVRSLSDETLMVAGDLGELASQLSSRFELLTGIPQRHSCLTHQGRVMGDECTLGRLQCNQDALICLRSALKGSGKPPVEPGSWHCYRCNLGGCWPARNTCFQCLAPRGETAPVASRRPQLEDQALGRAPQRSPAVEPTHSLCLALCHPA